jgi:predicted TIM-barrel fold metal-dependent hydrolase
MFLEAKDKDLALLCVRAYNDWIVEEWCADSGGRLIPLSVMPLWDAEMAALEVRRMAELGCRAVTFPELPSPLGLPSIHSPEGYWDPFFRACDETQTVVCMHIGSSSRAVSTSDDAPASVGIALLFTNAVASFIDLIFSGILERFPHLKLAYSEGQIGWMPFVLERMDNMFRKHTGQQWAEINSSVRELPSSYIADHIYGCFFDDEFGLRSRDSIGTRQITFEVDYPHQESLWPHTVDKVQTMAEILNAEELYRVVRGNAIDLFNLDAR